jgi:HD-GYP domain-containing protein (c-di-GMP phosphodiesterase class II)
MSETQALLSRIVSLRQRLELAQGLARLRPNADTAPPHSGESGDPLPAGPARVAVLEEALAEGADCARQLDYAVRPLTAAREPGLTLPAQLTARARRVLERARDLFQALRGLADEPAVREPRSVASALHGEATALTDAALRMVQGLPDSPAVQLQQCEGIEAALAAVAHRLASLGEIVGRHNEEAGRIGLLADCLVRLDSGAATDLAPVLALAESMLVEASDCAPLRFHRPPVPAPADRDWVARSVACHSLTVAQVVARLVRLDPELRPHSGDAVFAALLHDVGMLRISPAILSHAGPLADDSRREVEGHCRAGAEVLAALVPGVPGLADAATHHHERTDGTGYPDGLREAQLTPLSRLLAVCDVYAASCCPRPYRPARETRTALTDVLLLAEQGALDRHFAERLLQLSFYPVGSVVELADGSVGVVVAVPLGRRDLNAPARPVVAIMVDANNRYLPAPRYVDLAQSDRHRIVRALSAAERRILDTRYPEWAA